MPSEHGPSGARGASMTITVNGEPVGGVDLAAQFAGALREAQAQVKAAGASFELHRPIDPPSTIKSDRLRKLWALMLRAEVRLPKYGEL